LSLNPSDFRVVVDAAGRGPGRYDLDVRVLPVQGGLSVDDFSPKKISVELREAPPTPTPTNVPAPPGG
jgi:hypothetical protein